MTWTTYTDENDEPVVRGPDGGVVIADEEHDFGARITLERLGEQEPFGITCGIYGWMMHSRFIETRGKAQADYDAMKRDLATIVEMIPLKSDRDVDLKMDKASVAISAFVDRFP